MEPVLFETRDGVALITLNRPEQMNAADWPLKKALLKALLLAQEETSVRAVLLTGNGRCFCSGQDLKEMRGESSVGDVVRNGFNPIIRTLRQMPKPTVGAINGAAVGAGMGIALATDIRIASDRASLIQAFVKIGLVPDSGSFYFLKQLVGEAKAFELAALGDAIGAEEALGLGVVNRVVPHDQLMDAAWQVARRLANGPTQAIALIKQGLQQAHDLEGTLEMEAQYQEIMAETADFREGVTAFLEKRPPNFGGT